MKGRARGRARPAERNAAAIQFARAKTGFDEVFDAAGGVRSHYRRVVSTLESWTTGELARREQLQKLSLMSLGITFTVYGDKDGIERVWPFGFVPRVLAAAAWRRIDAGPIQRVAALNVCLAATYADARPPRDGV